VTLRNRKREKVGDFLPLDRKKKKVDKETIGKKKSKERSYQALITDPFFRINPFVRDLTIAQNYNTTACALIAQLIFVR